VTQDVLRVAAHQQPVQAASSMGAADDEIGAPFPRLGHDAGTGGFDDGLDLGCIHLDLRAADQGLRLRQQQSAVLAQRLEHAAVDVHLDHRIQRRGIHHVQQPDAGVQRFCQLDGLVQARVRGIAAIHGHQDLRVHRGSP